VRFRPPAGLYWTDPAVAESHSKSRRNPSDAASEAVVATVAARPHQLGAFVTGGENRLAAWAVPAAVRDDRSTAPLVVLYGPSGSGKSHLVRDLAAAWRHAHPQGKLELVSAGEFHAQYVDAIATDRVAAWSNALAGADLLIVEDLGQLAGKRRAEEQLCRIIDALANNGGQLVVTCRMLPPAMPGLCSSLRSRMAEGLLVNVSLPGPEARRALVDRFAQSRGLPLPQRVVRTLANGLEQPAPVLFGAVLRLEAAARAAGGTVRLDEAAALAAVAACAPQVTLRCVATKTARYFGLPLAALKGPRRHQQVVSARSVAMLLARQLTANSLRRIGDYFGRRDHATVRHACAQAKVRVRRDPATRQAVHDLRRQLLAE
jgi:chromosomal replication initiator protein